MKRYTSIAAMSLVLILMAATAAMGAGKLPSNQYVSQVQACEDRQQTPKELAARTGTRASDWTTFECTASYWGNDIPSFVVKKDELVVALSTGNRTWQKGQWFHHANDVMIIWFASRHRVHQYGTPPKVSPLTTANLIAYVQNGIPKGKCWTRKYDPLHRLTCQRGPNDPAYKIIVPLGMVGLVDNHRVILAGYRLLSERIVLMPAIHALNVRI